MDCRKWIDRYSTDCSLKYNSQQTRKNYISCVASFLFAFNKYREPKEIPTQEIKEWLLKAKTINTRKHLLCSVKSFYQITVGMPDKIDKIPYPRSEKKLPFPLDVSEIQSIIRVCENIKHKAIIVLMYATGMRVGEVINLKIKDVDGKRKVINIINGKGGKDRQVQLPEILLTLLRNYYIRYKPVEYLFNGQDTPQYSDRSVNQFLNKYANKAGIKKHVHAHLLRHSFATHSLESGVDISILQKLLGHNRPSTTQIYTHVSTKLISNTYSPIQNLNL